MAARAPNWLAYVSAVMIVLGLVWSAATMVQDVKTRLTHVENVQQFLLGRFVGPVNIGNTGE